MLAPSPWSFNRNVNLRARVTALSLAACLAGACTGLSATPPVTPPTPTPAIVAGIHKIQHVVVIMQENRSFDQYFGTFPGADGLPVQNGQFTACVPDTATNVCVKPYHDSSDLNYGGPHGEANATADINGRFHRRGAEGPECRVYLA